MNYVDPSGAPVLADGEEGAAVTMRRGQSHRKEMSAPDADAASHEKRGERVAVFLPTLGGGGAERAILTVANSLSDDGHEVDLLLATRTGPYLREVRPGVNVVDLGAGRVARALVPLTRYLRTRRPVVLLSAMGHANIVAMGSRTLARTTTRVVMSERGSAALPASRRRLGPILRLLARFCYPRADAVIAVSEGVRRELIDLRGLDPEKVHTIYNPMDLENIERSSREEVDHPWLAADDVPVFVAVGRLTEVKGFDVLLRAFRELLETDVARLIILGDGPLRSDLQELARDLGIDDRVDMVGFDDNPYRWMAKSFALVLSSHSEGLPNVLIQAMACGTRVISTDCAHGPREILEGGRWGQLVPPGDPRALARAMHGELERVDPPLVRERAERFATEGIAREYATVMGVVE